MHYRTLGRTNLQVSELSLGGLFTSSLGPERRESERMVRTAIDRGINYIDTAPAYADSEEVLGEILRHVQAPLMVSTKLGGRPIPFDPQDRLGLIRSVETSLRLLHRDVIDVLFIHEPDRPGQYRWWTDPRSVQGPVLDVISELRDRGRVRFAGLGGTTVTELTHLVRNGSFDVLLTAFNYSALFREAETELLPSAAAKQMGVVLGSVLQQGALARRYDDVLTKKPMWLAESRRRQMVAYYQLLDDWHLDIVELGVRFALGNPHASTVLIGPKTEAQLDFAVRAREKGQLEPACLEQLDRIAKLVPARPFEEPMILPFHRPDNYHGPGPANLAPGIR